VQYHPTCMPGTGLLFTEACRGEGGILTNKDGYRYLQDYGLGPPDPWPRKKAMELGPRDRISQAFWHEQRKGRTLQLPNGESAVNLDLRHLGHAKLRERLPQICDLAHEFLGIDPAAAPIPVRPAVHYTMGGIPTNVRAATELPGLYAAGECASSGIHGANRLGSNSLAELCVFGRVAGEDAARFAKQAGACDEARLRRQAEESANRAARLLARPGAERLADVRNAMAQSMERGCGIYRTAQELGATCTELAALKERAMYVGLADRSPAWNTEWLGAIELGFQLDVAQAMAHSAYARRESRGAHQRLDDGCAERNDAAFLKHTLAWLGTAGAPPRIGWSEVVITRSQPGVRAYGAEGEALEKAPATKPPALKAVNA
jgi:succinate dehydrogenase flavoprotein subunit